MDLMEYLPDIFSKTNMRRRRVSPTDSISDTRPLVNSKGTEINRTEQPTYDQYSDLVDKFIKELTQYKEFTVNDIKSYQNKCPGFFSIDLLPFYKAGGMYLKKSRNTLFFHMAQAVGGYSSYRNNSAYGCNKTYLDIVKYIFNITPNERTKAQYLIDLYQGARPYKSTVECKQSLIKNIFHTEFIELVSRYSTSSGQINEKGKSILYYVHPYGGSGDTIAQYLNKLLDHMSEELINSTNRIGQTFLHYRIKKGHILPPNQILPKLHERKFDFSVMIRGASNSDRNLVRYAIKYKQYDYAESLLMGYLPLDLNNLRIIVKYLELKRVINVIQWHHRNGTLEDSTILELAKCYHEALPYSESVPKIKAIITNMIWDNLEEQDYIYHQDTEGTSLLHFLAYLRCDDILKEIVYHTSISFKHNMDNNGKTPYDIYMESRLDRLMDR